MATQTLWLGTSLMLLLLLASTAGETPEIAPTDTPLNEDAVLFMPDRLIQVIEGDHFHVLWTTNVPGVANVSVTDEDEGVGIAVLDMFKEVSEEGSNVTTEGSINVTAIFIGYNTITLTLYDQDGQEIGFGTLPMSVLLKYQQLSTIFSTSIGVLIGIVYINMGATIDLNIVKGIAKKPIGPIVGIICQYGGMPLIAFGLSQLVFPGEPLYQLGMFLSGTCPGGGSSNMWTYLLGGRLDLSIMMTFCSTLFAFLAVPAWVMLVGPVISQGEAFVIPFSDIAITVVSLVIPCLVGILIQRFLPRVAKLLRMLLTPFSIFNILYIFTFGFYANRYIFQIIDARIIVAGLALPVLGYIIGIILATLLRMKREDVIAVSIETGIQNTTIALFILNFTLEKPAGSLAVVVPAASVMMTPIPLMMIYAVKLAYNKIKSRRGAAADSIKNDKTGGDCSRSPSVMQQDASATPEKTKEEDKNTTAMQTCPEKCSAGIDNPAAELADQPV